MARAGPLPRPVPPASTTPTTTAPAAPPAAAPATVTTTAPAAPPAAAPGPTTTTPAPTSPPASSMPVTRRWFRISTPQLLNSRRVAGVIRLAIYGCRRAAIQGSTKSLLPPLFFGPLHWTSSKNTRGVLEECQVPFDVTVNGVSLGMMTLRVSHADYRVAAQNTFRPCSTGGPS